MIKILQLNKFDIRILLFLFLCLPLIQVKASHVLGADMTYSYLGNKKYVIYMIVYRDCRGVAINSSSNGFDYYRVYKTTSHGGCIKTYSASPKLQKIENISNICQWQKTPCSPSNTYSTGFGIERQIYTDTLNLNDSIVKSEIKSGRCYLQPVIVMKADNRSYACEINLCNLSSPKIAYNNGGEYFSMPDLKVVQNQGMYLSFGVIDPENDSIVYKFSKGQYGTCSGTYLSYTSPKSSDFPISCYCIPTTTIKCTPQPYVYPPKGMYLDNNGDVIFTPTNATDYDNIAVEATQYRKDSTGKLKYLGYTRRDYFVWSVTSSNNFPPLLSAKNGYKICAGRKLTFDFSLKDSQWAGYQSAPDTLQVRFLGVPNGATMTEKSSSVVNHKKYQFNWDTKLSDTSSVSYKIRIEANDRNCSNQARIYRTIHILVDGKCCDSFIMPKVSPPKTYTVKVGDSVLMVSDTVANYKKATYGWLGKAPHIDYGKVLEGQMYRVLGQSKLKISKINFGHHQMSYQLLGNTDICRDSGILHTVKIADTCFFKQTDTTVYNIYDTIIQRDTFITKITFRDTVTTKLTFNDTIITRLTQRDTLYFTKNDTVKFSIYDTIRVVKNDTIRVIQTIAVQDTLRFTIPDKNQGEFTVYPVPTNRLLYLKVYDYKYFEGYSVKIYDILNNLIEEREIVSDITEFRPAKWGSKGNYTLHLFDPNKNRVAVKVIIYM
jgi:hypothetical protein